MFESIIYRKPNVSPEYQEQLDNLAGTLAVSGLNRFSVENALYRGSDHGHIPPEVVQQTLEHYEESFGEGYKYD